MNRDELKVAFNAILGRHHDDGRALLDELCAAADQYAAHLIQEHAGPPPWRAGRKTSSERKEA